MDINLGSDLKRGFFFLVGETNSDTVAKVIDLHASYVDNK